MAASWAEKYRPRRLADVVGNPQAVEAMRAWARSWQENRPQHKGLLLHGPPGAGKTSAALALAVEFGWGVIELNASDVRSAAAIERVAGLGSRHETFTDAGEYFASAKGQRKLIVLDEADNLYERGGEEATVGGQSFSDRGGRRAILDTLAKAQQPILLIANDSYALTKGSSTLQKHCQLVPFRHLTTATLAKLLMSVAASEARPVPEPVVREIAQRAHGDARSALNDLQAICEGRAHLDPQAAAALGERNRPETMFDALGKVLKGTDGASARMAVQDLDEAPDFVLAWLDENTPREYKDPGDLARAYDWLSRADVFLGRVVRRQSYSLWGTATDLLSIGVSSAKERAYGTPPYYQFPSWIRKMSITKAHRAREKDLVARLAPLLHTGYYSTRTEMVPALRRLSLADPEFAESLCLRANLEEDQIRTLLGPEAHEELVEQLVRHVEARRAQPPTQAEVESEDEPAAPAPAAADPAPSKSRSLLDF